MAEKHTRECTAIDDKVHNEIVRITLDELKKRGFTNLRADFENMTSPEKINGYVPDLTFNKNDKQGTFVILEVETCNTITHENTGKKWKVFYERTRDVGAEFHLAIPKFCNSSSGRTLAKQRLEKLHIKADAVWVANGSLRYRVTGAKTRNGSR